MLVTWVVAAMMVMAVLSEPGCDKVWETFQELVPGERSFAMVKVRNSPQCYNMCARTQGCKAMSYNFLSNLCQLYAQPCSHLMASRDSVYGELVHDLHEGCSVLKKTRLDCSHCPEGHACVYHPKPEISSQCLPVADCGEPPWVAKATKKVQSTKLGSTVNYTCDDGHVFNGTWSNISCTMEGWSPLQGNCIANCSTPPQVDHANVTANSTLEGSQVNYTFTCPLGMELQGHVTAVCNSSGLWEGPLGRCLLVDCGQPPLLANASWSGNVTTNGSSVSYTCQAGWVYNGSSPTAMCSPLGNWTLPDANCSSPPDKDKATVSFSSTAEGAEARYHCVVGMEIRGLQTEACLPTGHWTNSTGPCQRCNASLTSVVPDEFFTASGVYSAKTYNDGPFPPHLARINSTTAWAANSSSSPSWLQINLADIREVTAVVTGRRVDFGQWVLNYTLSWSNDTSSWEGNTTYDGNNGSQTLKTHYFDPPIIAQYFNFSIGSEAGVDFYHFPSMRVDLLGCLPQP